MCTFLTGLSVFSSWRGVLHILWICLFGYILQLCDLPFHSLNGVFWWTEVLNFSDVQPITFFISLLCPVEELSAYSKSQRCSPWPFSLKAFLLLLLAFVSATRLELIFVCDGGTDPDTRFLIRVFIDSTHLSEKKKKKGSHSPLFCNAASVINQDAHKCFQTLVCSEVRSPPSHGPSSALLQLHIRQWLQHRSFISMQHTQQPCTHVHTHGHTSLACANQQSPSRAGEKSDVLCFFSRHLFPLGYSGPLAFLHEF